MCRGTHQVSAQISAVKAPPGIHILSIGSEVRIDRPLDAIRGYVRVRAPEQSEPLLFLEDGIVVHGERLWTEVTYREGRIENLRLVVANLDELDRLHFIAPPSSMFWDWADSLFDPRAYNEDVDTDDAVRALRLKLLVRGVMPARTFLEARLAAPTYGLEAIDEFEGSNEHWLLRCRTPHFEKTLTFSIRDTSHPVDELLRFGEGRSQIIPPDVFRYRALHTAGAIPLYLEDLDGKEIDLVRRGLDTMIEYLSQVLAFTDGSGFVPVEAFVGDSPREVRTRRPHLYASTWLVGERAIYQRDLANVHCRPRRLVRSALEADLFMSLHPCPHCEAKTPRLPSRVVVKSGELTALYEGACTTCGRTRRFEFQLGDTAEPETVVAFGEGVSSVLDPGQWLAAADLVMREAAEKASGARDYSLAVAALGEALKFIPVDSDVIPLSAIRTRGGWQYISEDPDRLNRAWIEGLRDRLRTKPSEGS